LVKVNEQEFFILAAQVHGEMGSGFFVNASSWLPFPLTLADLCTPIKVRMFTESGVYHVAVRDAPDCDVTAIVNKQVKFII
jgi:hypothetical protein